MRFKIDIDLNRWRVLDYCACCNGEPSLYVRDNREHEPHHEVECSNPECANLEIGDTKINAMTNWNIEQRIRLGRIGDK